MTTSTEKRVKAGMVFTMKNGRKRYVIITAHRNGDISYAPEKDVQDIIRVTRGEFEGFMGKLVETRQEAERRVRGKKIDRERKLQIAAAVQAQVVATAYKEALMEDLLREAASGADLNGCIERLKEMISEAEDVSYDTGLNQGYAESERYNNQYYRE